MQMNQANKDKLIMGRLDKLLIQFQVHQLLLDHLEEVIIAQVVRLSPRKKLKWTQFSLE